MGDGETPYGTKWKERVKDSFGLNFTSGDDDTSTMNATINNKTICSPSPTNESRKISKAKIASNNQPGRTEDLQK
jgi:hypothetical protein